MKYNENRLTNKLARSTARIEIWRIGFGIYLYRLRLHFGSFLAQGDHQDTITNPCDKIMISFEKTENIKQMFAILFC